MQTIRSKFANHDLHLELPEQPAIFAGCFCLKIFLLLLPLLLVLVLVLVLDGGAESLVR